MASFDVLYKKLNKEQKKAVDTIEGPVMVIAGPGTGKTQILALRIANILKKTDVPPDAILALTFTEAGVRAMRKRLVDMLGSTGYRVGIFTFHGFCNEVIKRFPENFPRIIGSRNITDIEKISLLKKIIESSKLKHLKPYGDPLYYLNQIRGKISDLKRDNIKPEDLDKEIKKVEKEFSKIDDLEHPKGPHKGKIKGKYLKLQKDIEKHQELLSLYKKYEKELLKEKLYDYEDMIIETINSFGKNEDLLLRIQEEYQYVLADEHQDANNGQNRLLELITSFHKNPNLFIVGDEKQAIFRFQGASLENFLYFKKKYAKAEEINLVENYRSTQDILDSAHSMIEKSSASEIKRVKLKSNTKKEVEPIKFYSFSEPSHEYNFLVSDIKSKIKKGVDPNEIAILYRDNRDVEPILKYLDKEKVSFVIESDQNILQDDDIQKIIITLRAVHNFGEDSFITEFLHIDFLNISSLDIYRLLNYARRERISIYEIISTEKLLKDSEVKDVKKMLNTYLKLSHWKTVSYNNSLSDLIESVVHESGLIKSILSSEESVEKMDKISSFFEEIKKMSGEFHKQNLESFLGYLDLMNDHNVYIKKDKRSVKTKEIRLMTAHKSKGLEFDHVYITGATDGHWGNRRRRNSFSFYSEEVNENDDERRLFYVAMTRARKSVSVTCSLEDLNGKEVLPSQFVGEIDTKKIESTFSKNKNILFEKTKKQKIKISDKEYLNTLFFDRGMNVTALNNYLKCPWQYFYTSLVRIPHLPERPLLYGTAVHGALKEFFDNWKDYNEVDKSTLISLFEKKLRMTSLSDLDFEELSIKGKKSLSGFYDKYKKDWHRNILNEFRIEGVHLKLPNFNLRLRGDIDKMEILNDKKEVNVVDYKTGKQRSRNYIEGNTKGSNGDYKRQLTFYNLLLNLYDKGKYKMVSGEIDFIEPNERGNYSKEKFLVSESEIEELKKLIEKVSNEIVSLSFWNDKCDDRKCKYCSIRAMLA